MNSIYDVSRAVDKKLDTPAKWTKGAYARLADGIGVYETCPDAASYCLVGCIRSLCPGPLASETISYLEKIAECTSLISWQDHPNRTFLDIKTLLHRAYL